jgi:nucleotide-binding universal stress UspA family protein
LGERPVSRVIVGYDGSGASTAALEEGAKQAEWQELPLEVITAWSVPAVSSPYPIDLDPHDFERDARHILDDGVRRLRQLHPKVDVTARAVQDDPRNALLAATAEDDYLVVGSRGCGGVVGMLLGSVAARCIREAPCPVLVVHR